MTHIELGTVVPQGIGSELQAVERANHRDLIKGYVTTAERLGFDSLWVSDHFHQIRTEDAGGVHESWTLLTAASQWTERVRLGQIVMCSAFRNPALLAKMAATLDVLSGGRLVLGLGAGWYQQEYEAYGYTFPPATVRLAQLEETVQIVRMLWEKPEASFSGAHFHVDQAVCTPKPLQQLPPLLIGGTGKKVTLRLVAQYADIANFSGGTPEAFAEASTVLDRHCEMIGRDPASIRRTWMTLGVLIGESDDEVRRRVEALRIAGDVRWIRLQKSGISGTPEQLIDCIGRFVDAGCDGVMMHFTDAPAMHPMEHFADAVMPAFH